ncbi:Unknown protein, partial [Striga hermonthica]
AGQAPGQQVVTMTREEMQRIAAAAAAQAVQQVASHTSHATTAPATATGNQDEDVSSYGEGGVARDRAMERMAEQLRQLQDKVEGRPEGRARGHPFAREILATPLPANFKETNLVYDGSSDPSRHVRTFENMAVLHGYSDSEIQMIEGCEGRKFRIGKDLEEPIRSRLIDLVREFADIFAYTAEELTGISAEVIEHRLNIDLSVRPVKQKRRHHGAEMDKIIEQEVEKLLGAGHIKEIKFPEWLSNTVMVSKSEGKWRMCIDFRDLNKACPKDLYPLPRIDQLVDSTAGCELLSLMDASQGYHQIPLAREDRKRVSFVTSRGTYCYVVMPFGLKNAGATYQRLVDKIFKEQLGRNMEVYVDDMLVKSKEELDHVRDLKETFLTLRRYDMKLNLAKCSFGVRSGKFLGYLVTKRGIEVNPEKVRAVMEMKSPTNVKEVQSLAGRIAGLSRFISKVAEKSGPLFKTLKKSAKFQWTEEAQKAFEELRGVLANLPLLAKPVQGEELVLYISIGERAVSSVMLREEGTAQLPIYYLSRVMQGAETRYSEIEKCALAVVVTARKLIPYFLNHKVKIRTNMPLGETLGRPSVSGRLVKWAIELSEYSLLYEPRRAIKAQVLADFIQEGTKVEEEVEGLM